MTIVTANDTMTSDKIPSIISLSSNSYESETAKGKTICGLIHAISYHHPKQKNSAKVLAYSSFSSSRNLSPEPSTSSPQSLSCKQEFLPKRILNGHWQSKGDINHRRRMIAAIVECLKVKDKIETASFKLLKDLPLMVKQLEKSLYMSAPSFEEYNDTSTLNNRLQQLRSDIFAKGKQNKTKAKPPGVY
mmetsp:Transcript_33066/g.48462  ORF Transcript_33066/g.48462 Transcript_33066/m.48462 type:complete len:189 (+) Transcript_33066:206-772(+)|eukprot:CAMPEP_0195532696 /NCGR_PEP_ID=MMETSP0794_2-20130614/38885_1 /TAXON_ID=515487 /ORGANISM="Stephanopyxis turris, Strain CCMP 815" /LENGTH=188 /DNA_ID=CAMNT_0040665025 /DNA_START=202 /DNA_END=768 /DNA_ORIENTATION=-